MGKRALEFSAFPPYHFPVFATQPENLIEALMGFKTPKGAVDSGVVDLR